MSAANIQTIRSFAKSVKNRLKAETKKRNRKRVPFGFGTMNDDDRQEIEAERSEAREQAASLLPTPPTSPAKPSEPPNPEPWGRALCHAQ